VKVMEKEECLMSDIFWIRCEVENNDLIPKYQTQGAAGCDLYASGDYTIKPGRRGIISTGLKIELPPGFEAQVRPRSGLAAKYGITVLNTPGTVDEDYRGEIKVILLNTGDEEFSISKGDRIAQLVFSRVFRGIFQPTESLSSTDRGNAGFGSTGKA
jgi:dUTP pyrophosphatase